MQVPLFAGPSETPPAFIKKVADGLITRLKADQSKLQNDPPAGEAIVRQNLYRYIDSQAFTRIVMGNLCNVLVTMAECAQFEKNFRETLIENYGLLFKI